MSNNRLLQAVGGTVVAVVLLAAFVSLRGAKVPVRAAAAVREPIANTITTNGKVEPAENFEARAPLATTVRRVLVKEGDAVRQGQLLVQLDDADARAEAARARAQLRAAEAELSAVDSGGTREEVLTTQATLTKARTELADAQHNLEALRKLLARNAASQAEVQQAEARLKRAQADVELQESKLGARYSRPEIARTQARAQEARAAHEAALRVLEASHVRAPFDGTVYSLPVRQGAYVQAGDLLAQVANLSRVQVRAFVDEPEIGRLAPGQPITLRWDALPRRVWEGKVIRVPSIVISRGTRNVGEVICEVDNSDGALLPNVNVNVVLTTARHENALTVPREAVHQENGSQYVFQIVGGELKKRAVQTSISSLSRIEIASGLEENAQVALGAEGSPALRDALPVRVVER